jgi:hypothetical protein
MKKIRLYLILGAGLLSLLLTFALFNVSSDINNFTIFVIYPFVLVLIIWLVTGKAIQLRGAALIILYPLVSIIPFIIILPRILGISNSAQLTEFIVCFFIIFILNYSFLVIVNIFNGLSTQYIPLEQVARTAQFIISIFIFYINTFLFFSGSIDRWLMLLFFIISTFFQLYINSFFARFHINGVEDVISFVDNNRVPNSNKRGKIINKLLLKPLKENIYLIGMRESALLTLIMLFFVLSLLPWNILIFLKTLNATLVYYLIFNLVLESKQKTRANLGLEYTFVLIIVVFTLLINAEWGVYGSLVL